MNQKIPHVMKKCDAKTRSGGRCKRMPSRAGRCHLHGGKTPVAWLSPHFKHGYYSKYHPNGWMLKASRRTHPCIVIKANGEQCKQWAMWEGKFGRCVAHQYVTDEELFYMRFPKFKRYRKPIRERKWEPLTDKQIARLMKSLKDLNLDELLV